MDLYNPFNFLLFLFLLFVFFWLFVYLLINIKYFLIAFKRAGDFSGRSNRKEFWVFITYSNLISGLLDQLTSTSGDNPVIIIFLFIIVLPSISLFIRRMHDIDKRGWFILIPLWNIIFSTFKGTKGPNRFGPESGY